MTTCILVRKHPTDPSLETVVTRPDGKIPVWNHYTSAYAAGIPGALVLEATSRERMAQHLCVSPELLVAA